MKANHVASTSDCAQKRVTGEEMICTQIGPGLVTLANVPGSRATLTLSEWGRVADDPSEWRDREETAFRVSPSSVI
jgi:hypothetical protein